MIDKFDGQYKFDHCIFRDQEISNLEIALCGTCGGGTKVEKGYLCKERGLLLTEENKISQCTRCWAGRQVVDGVEENFYPFARNSLTK